MRGLKAQCWLPVLSYRRTIRLTWRTQTNFSQTFPPSPALQTMQAFHVVYSEKCSRDPAGSFPQLHTGEESQLWELKVEWSCSETAEWCVFWLKETRWWSAVLIQSSSHTLLHTWYLLVHNLAGSDNFLCSPLRPHPFHVRPQFSGH